MSRTAPGEPDLLRQRDVLVLSPNYKYFTKNYIDILAERCRSVTVLIRYNRFADVGEYVPIDFLKTHCRESLIVDERPDNVTVEPLPLYYLPIDSQYRKMGAKHYRAARETLEASGRSFDLIHAHFTWSSGYVAARLGEERDVPTALTVHANDDWFREMHHDGHEDIHYTWRTVDGLIRVNEQDAPLLATYNDNVHSIPNGFSREEFPLIERAAARDELGVSPDVQLVFALGGLNERKRFHQLVDAVGSLTDRHDIRCVIAGRGPEKRRLRRRVSANGLDDVVSVPGYLPQDRVARWMNAADLFVLPSEAEGNPTVMFEALGCGTPYVGADVGGVGEIITSAEYGLVYPPDEPERLPELIEEGLQRDWDRETVREYGEQFTWERIVDQTFDVYGTIVTDAPREPVERGK